METLLDLGGYSTGVHRTIKEKLAKQFLSVSLPRQSGRSRPDIESDITSRLFEDDSFEAVSLIDVLEHVKPDLRLQVLQLACAYARSCLIVTFPFESKLNYRLETDFISRFGAASHPAIAEHRALGLPQHQDYDHFLEGQGSVTKTFHTCSNTLFEGLRDQVKVEDEETRHKISREMNARLDCLEPLNSSTLAYRCCIVVDFA